ncbi:DciA family protein [Thermodesulfobium sp.]|jgi:hypothetical protein
MIKLENIILNQLPKNLKECLITEKNWEEIVGLKLSQISRPIGLNNRTLIISTNHPTISRELSLYSNIIIDRIKKKLDINVEKLKFKTSDYKVDKKSNTEDKDKETHLKIDYPNYILEIENKDIREKILNIYKTLKIRKIKCNEGDE